MSVIFSTLAADGGCGYHIIIARGIIIFGVGYGVARSTSMGNARALSSGTSDWYRLPRLSFYFKLLNGVAEQQNILFMKIFYKALSIITLILCFSFSAMAETASLWVGESYTFTCNTDFSERISGSYRYTYGGFSWSYSSSGDSNYFTLTQNSSNNKQASVTINKYFSDTKKVLFNYTETVWKKQYATGSTSWWWEPQSNNKKKITYYVECKKANVTLSPTTVALSIGQTKQLSWQFSPVNSNPAATVSFTSSNMSVATVNSYGLITAVKLGTATITATTNFGTTATCTVTVKAAG